MLVRWAVIDNQLRKEMAMAISTVSLVKEIATRAAQIEEEMAHQEFLTDGQKGCRDWRIDRLVECLECMRSETLVVARAMGMIFTYMGEGCAVMTLNNGMVAFDCSCY